MKYVNLYHQFSIYYENENLYKCIINFEHFFEQLKPYAFFLP